MWSHSRRGPGSNVQEEEELDHSYRSRKSLTERAGSPKLNPLTFLEHTLRSSNKRLLPPICLTSPLPAPDEISPPATKPGIQQALAAVSPS
ncbi:hypothetical protein GRJ2_000851700 [Grus japonensis]|uniref:Uncharacterized protein n=1 Tax=Grus japonensis TaxID=30415 RepID=A0ABC9WGB8_GRUJA